MNKENDFILVREFYDFLLDIKSNKNLSELDDLFYLFKDIKINSQSIYEYNVYYYLIKTLISEDIDILSSSNYYEINEEELSYLPLDIQLDIRKHSNNTLIIHINNFSINGGKIRPDLVIGKGDKKIVVEFDSFKYHSDSKQLMKDKQRERIIQALGYQVYRFSNKEIIENLGGVINEIIKIIKREL